MIKYLLLLCTCCLLLSCQEDDDRDSTFLGEECFGYNMVDTWLVVDSIEYIYVGLDSIYRCVKNEEMIFYENGSGKKYSDFLNSDVFFSWNIQCDPDILTMNYPTDYDDSLVSFFSIHQTLIYDVLINQIDYKKMKLKQTDSISQIERKKIIIRDMTKQ